MHPTMLRASRALPLALAAAVIGVLGSTLVTHAVFFGASRYALVVQPWTAALAFLALPGMLPPRVLIPLRRLRARVLGAGGRP